MVVTCLGVGDEELTRFLNGFGILVDAEGFDAARVDDAHGLLDLLVLLAVLLRGMVEPVLVEDFVDGEFLRMRVS